MFHFRHSMTSRKFQNPPSSIRSIRPTIFAILQYLMIKKTDVKVCPIIPTHGIHRLAPHHPDLQWMQIRDFQTQTRTQVWPFGNMKTRVYRRNLGLDTLGRWTWCTPIQELHRVSTRCVPSLEMTGTTCRAAYLASSRFIISLSSCSLSFFISMHSSRLRPSGTVSINSTKHTRIAFATVLHHGWHGLSDHVPQSKGYKVSHVYSVIQLKWSQLTFLLVTFECIGKIQWFFANVITVQTHTLGVIKI